MLSPRRSVLLVRRKSTQFSEKRRSSYALDTRIAMSNSPEKRTLMASKFLQNENPELLKEGSCSSPKSDLILFRGLRKSKFSRTNVRNENRDNVKIDYSVCRELFKVCLLMFCFFIFLSNLLFLLYLAWKTI